MKKLSGLIALIIGFLCLTSQCLAVVERPATQSAALKVSANVPAQSRDFIFNFTSDHDNAVIGADQEIEYTITYGSLLTYGTPMTIEAEWTLGTVPDQSLYSYNILSYVAGSATKDYWGESTPVVDTVHRKITWTVKRFPPNTIGKTLKFRLKTPGVYVTDKNVNFTVRARMIETDTTVGWINLDQVYSPTEFIRREIKGLQLLVAEVRRVTDSSFSLFIVTSQPTKTVITYGLTPDNLDMTFTDNSLSDQKLLTIDGLLPSTTYYYRILIENDKGIQRKTPEVFQVTTSSTSLVALIDQDRVLVSAKGVLLKNTSGLGPGSTIVVPRGVQVELFLPFKNIVPSDVLLSLANQKVLGISTEGPPVTSDQKVRLLETQARTYTGTITAPSTIGLYDVLIEAESGEKGTNRDTLTTMVVSDPLTVTGENGRPVERAIVYLERYSDSKKKFEYFPAETYGAHNPAYTDSDGSVDLVLPEGQYMVNVNAIGFKTYQEKFYFNPGGSQPYPKAVLLNAPFNLLTYVSYYYSVLMDSVKFFNFSVDRLASSFRFLDLSLLVSIFLLSALSLMANLRRVKVTLEGFDIFSEKTLRRILRRPKPENLLVGFVESDVSEMPVHGAIVQLVDRKTRRLVARDITTGLGEFHLMLEPANEYELTIRKNGYNLYKQNIDIGILLTDSKPFVLAKMTAAKPHPVIEFIIMLVRTVFHATSDTLLFAVGILNLLLFMRLGVKVLPIFIITGFNALLWLEYEWHLYRAGKKQ